MSRLIVSLLLSGLACAFPLLISSPAHGASIADCGNIDVQANAQCQMEVSASCTTKCKPVNFQAACQGQLSVSCKGTPPSCSGSCQGTCEGRCTSNPSFSCSVDCRASCDSDCSGSCSSSANKTECQGQCKTQCSGQCDGSCNGSPVDCQGKCQGSCQGSCKGGEVACQAVGEASCEAKMQGGCETQCSKPDGALFCDGQYVDSGDHLQNCVNALNAVLNVKVSGSASSSCTGNQCNAEAEGKASCGGSVAPSAHSHWQLALGLVGALGAMSALRRRRVSK
jgi:hypothetical protein